MCIKAWAMKIVKWQPLMTIMFLLAFLSTDFTDSRILWFDWLSFFDSVFRRCFSLGEWWQRRKNLFIFSLVSFVGGFFFARPLFFVPDKKEMIENFAETAQRGVRNCFCFSTAPTNLLCFFRFWAAPFFTCLQVWIFNPGKKVRIFDKSKINPPLSSYAPRVENTFPFHPPAEGVIRRGREKNQQKKITNRKIPYF